MLGIELMIGAVIVGGWAAWEILKPKPNAIVLEKLGDNYYLSKAYHNDYYLQYRGLTFPIPSTYEYWVRLGRGFVRFRPKWIRFFYIEDTQLARITEGRSEPSISPELLSRFVESKTLEQILRSFTTPKMTILFYMLGGVVMGLMLGVTLAGWVA